MSVNVQGARAVVCGGASGIGAVIVAALTAAGARTGILDAVERPAALDGDIGYVRCNATDELAVSAALKSLHDSLGGHDILVNCIRFRTPRGGSTTVSWNDALAVDLTTYVNTTQAFCASNAEAKRGGAVVNLSSVLGTLIAPSQSLAYHCAKAAIEQMTRYLAVTYGPAGIRVNAVAPGLISRGEAEAAGAAATASTYARIAREVPLRRSGTAAEVADAVLYLASAQSSYVTGQVLVVDGGLAVREQADIAVRIPAGTDLV